MNKSIEPYWDDTNRDPATGKFLPAWIDTASLNRLVDEIVNGVDYTIEHKEIADLRVLIEAVQGHQSFDEQKKIVIYGGEILKCDLENLTIVCKLSIRTRFAEDVRFDNVHFVGEAWFSSGISAPEASRFDGEVWFNDTSFKSVSCFDRVLFEKAAVFQNTRFDGASFGSACFNNSARFGSSVFNNSSCFDSTRFNGTASFARALFRDKVYFRSVEFGQDVWFNNAHFYSVVNFHSSTVNRRLILGGERTMDADFGKNARVRFDGMVVRAGASVELSLDQLGRIGSLIEGEDSDDPEVLAIAKANYNQLRDFFQVQPSTDGHEELCNYRYLQLLRKVRALRAMELRKKKQRNWAWGVKERGVNAFDWCVKEQMLGYLIRTSHILVTGVVVIVVWAVIFGIGHRFGGVQYDRWNENPIANSIYFSVVTFTSLGYGDIQPTSVLMKVAAASEALAGLALMALFIVAWGRKMVR